MKLTKDEREANKELFILDFSKTTFQEVFAANQEKGFHPIGENEVFKKQKLLALAISEVTEALEALRKDKHANWTRFHNREPEIAFFINFEDNIKDTFGDELADAVIRLYDYAGVFNLHYKAIHREYAQEMFALAELDIQDVPAFLFSICRSITDIYHGAIGGDIVGEAIAKIHSLAISQKVNLQKHIDAKRKYNQMRPALHGKKF